MSLAAAAVRRAAVAGLVAITAAGVAAAPAAAATKPLDPDDPDLYRPASRQPAKPQPSVLDSSPALPPITVPALRRGVVVTPAARRRPARARRTTSRQGDSTTTRAARGTESPAAPGLLAPTLRPAASLDPAAAVLQRTSGNSSLSGLLLTTVLPGIAFVLWRRRSGSRVP